MPEQARWEVQQLQADDNYDIKKWIVNDTMIYRNYLKQISLDISDLWENAKTGNGKILFSHGKYLYLLGVLCLGLVCIIGTSGDEIIEEEEPTATVQSQSTGANTLPTAEIITPSDGYIINEGKLITFSGSGMDTEDGTLSGGALEWDSSIDKALGIGSSLHNIRLSKGTHRITLTAIDSDGGADSKIINITINPIDNTTPTAEITNPSDNSTFDKGNPITFIGTGYDTEDGELIENDLVWSSNLYGQIGLGNTVQGVNYLPIGTHDITLFATDSANTAGTALISITIQNTSPTATITYPPDSTTLSEGVPINFRGTGEDANDGILDGDSLEWISDKDGKIGKGSSPTVSDLSSGTHTITLIVTDSDGATDTTSISLTISNTAPEAAITHPQDNDTFSSSDLIIFNGTGTDTEDGNLYGNALVWTSDVDHYIGSGTSFTISTLSQGTHTITLTVSDRNGAVDSVSITLVIQ